MVFLRSFRKFCFLFRNFNFPQKVLSVFKNKVPMEKPAACSTMCLFFQLVSFQFTPRSMAVENSSRGFFPICIEFFSFSQILNAQISDKRIFPKFHRKKLWPQTRTLCYFVNFSKTFQTFLESYLAKSDIKGITERKQIVMLIFPAQAAMTCVLKNNMALDNVQSLNFCPFFRNLFFFYKN